MKIRMVKTRQATEDGHVVRQYVCGEEYEVSHWLACCFFRERAAVLVNKNLKKLYTLDAKYSDL